MSNDRYEKIRDARELATHSEIADVGGD